MRLSLENGTVVENPTNKQIASGLRSLYWATENTFAILERDPLTYIQARHWDGPEVDEPYFILEHQDGSLANHWNAIDGPIRLKRVIRAFQQFARQDNSWRGEFKWEQLHLS